MADISKEIRDFREALYGEEVRGSMISLAEKVNSEVESNTSDVVQAISNTNNAASNANREAGNANTAAGAANAAASNANNAASNVEATRQDILNRLAAGEFKGKDGKDGEIGPPGPQGQSGISITGATPLFTVYVDEANNGALHVVYDDAAGDPPPIQYRESDGAILWQYDDGT